MLGGDRRALDEVLADERLAPLRGLVADRVLDVPDPRLAVLRDTPQALPGHHRAPLWEDPVVNRAGPPAWWRPGIR